MSDMLAKIIATKREELARAQVPLSHLEQKIARLPPIRPFMAKLRQTIRHQGWAVIAEIKKASPSQGLIRADFDAVAIAQDYHLHQATCLSVLTDASYFQGSLDYLSAIHAAVPLPLLRKDFTIDRYHIAEARAFGASAILLIVSALADESLRTLIQAARDYGVEVLIETHNKEELNRALSLPLGDDTAIGVNNRDLKTFKVSLATMLDLKPQIPSDQIGICESGIHSPSDIAHMRAYGISAFLIGEAFMRAPSPGKALKSFFQ